MNFKIGDRVRVKILDTIICEYWNVPGKVIKDDYDSSEDEYVQSNPIAVQFEYAPFLDGFCGPHYFNETELELIECGE